MTRAAPMLAIAGPTLRVRRLAGRRVGEQFYETVHGRVTEVLPILASGEDYDAADLCGSTFMARLTPAGRRDVGLCLVDLAARGALPLTPLQDDADGPPRYRLT